MKTTTTNQKTFEKYDGKHYILYFNEQEKEVPAQQSEGEEQTTQICYEYDTLLAECTEPSIQAFQKALSEAGYEDAAIAATDIMLRAVQAGKIEGDAVELAHQLTKLLIDDYDKSTAVNEFSYQGQSMWLDREMRRTLRERLDRDIKKGLETTKLTYEDQTFELPTADAQAMLEMLEDYATECFDKTQEHQQAVAALTEVDDILAYDFTQGYPAKLEF